MARSQVGRAFLRHLVGLCLITDLAALASGGDHVDQGLLIGFEHLLVVDVPAAAVFATDVAVVLLQLLPHFISPFGEATLVAGDHHRRGVIHLHDGAFTLESADLVAGQCRDGSR